MKRILRERRGEAERNNDWLLVVVVMVMCIELKKRRNLMVLE